MLPITGSQAAYSYQVWTVQEVQNCGEGALWLGGGVLALETTDRQSKALLWQQKG